MRKIVEKIHTKMSIRELLKRGFFSGVGWAFGATIGFIVISTISVVVLNTLGGLPLIGNLIASIVQATLEQLQTRTPIFPN